jgi:hypothetical protein
MNKNRQMKKYRPRRRRSDLSVQKKHLRDFEQILEMDLFSLMVFLRSGKIGHAEKARQRIKQNLVNYTYDFETIGRDLGNGFPEVIRDYVASLNLIVKTPVAKIGADLISRHEDQRKLLQNKSI